MELEELWVFNLFALLVHSQVYHLCCLLFIVNLEALPKTGSMHSMVAEKWKSLDYKEWKFNRTKCFGGFEEKLSVLLRFYGFGKVHKHWILVCVVNSFLFCVVGEECPIVNKPIFFLGAIEFSYTMSFKKGEVELEVNLRDQFKENDEKI